MLSNKKPKSNENIWYYLKGECYETLPDREEFKFVQGLHQDTKSVCSYIRDQSEDVLTSGSSVTTGGGGGASSKSGIYTSVYTQSNFSTTSSEMGANSYFIKESIWKDDKSISSYSSNYIASNSVSAYTSAYGGGNNINSKGVPSLYSGYTPPSNSSIKNNNEPKKEELKTIMSYISESVSNLSIASSAPTYSAYIDNFMDTGSSSNLSSTPPTSPLSSQSSSSVSTPPSSASAASAYLSPPPGLNRGGGGGGGNYSSYDTGFNHHSTTGSVITSNSSTHQDLEGSMSSNLSVSSNSSSSMSNTSFNGANSGSSTTLGLAGSSNSSSSSPTKIDLANKPLPPIPLNQPPATQQQVLPWNESFQELLDKPVKSLEDERLRNQSITFFSELLANQAIKYVKTLVREVHFDPMLKTIKPYDAGGLAGGEKIKIDNMFIKFALNPYGIYEQFNPTSYYSNKSAGHELKSINALVSCGVPNLHFPLMCLLNFRGFRLIVISELPIASNTLVFGSSNAGHTIYENPTVSTMMVKIAEILNLKTHLVEESKNAVIRTNKQYQIPLAIDIEGHFGVDGRYYVVDTARLFPPEVPAPGITGSNLYRLFRPEFVKRYETQLCADSFSNFNIVDAETHNQEIVKAHEFLIKDVIPGFVNNLISLITTRKLNVKETLHKEGINLRYLGLVLYHINVHTSLDPAKKQSLRGKVSVEMLARLSRFIIFSEMRRLNEPEDEPHLRLALSHLNYILTNEFRNDTLQYWAGFMTSAMIAKYTSSVQSQKEEELLVQMFRESKGLHLYINMEPRLKYKFLKKFIQLTGVTFTNEFLQKLKNSISYIITLSDVLEIKVTVKHMKVLSSFKTFERFEEAETYYLNELKFKSNKLGKDHTQVAITHIHLADLYGSYSLLSKAEDNLISAIKIYCSRFGDQDIGTATTREKLALLYIKQQKFVDSIKLFKEVLEVKRKVGSAESIIEVADTYDNIAWCYQNQGMYEQALMNYHQALKIKMDKTSNSMSIAKTLNNLGHLFLSHNELNKSLDLFNKVKDIFIQQRGEDHSDVATALDNIGMVHSKKHNYVLAEQNFKSAINIRTKQFGKMSRFVAIAQDHLAQLYVSWDKSKYNEAERLFRSSIEIVDNSPDYYSRGFMRYNLSKLYRKKKDKSKELQWIQDARQIFSMHNVATDLMPKIEDRIQNLNRSGFSKIINWINNPKPIQVNNNARTSILESSHQAGHMEMSSSAFTKNAIPKEWQDILNEAGISSEDWSDPNFSTTIQSIIQEAFVHQQTPQKTPSLSDTINSATNSMVNKINKQKKKQHSRQSSTGSVGEKEERSISSSNVIEAKVQSLPTADTCRKRDSNALVNIHEAFMNEKRKIKETINQKFKSPLFASGPPPPPPGAAAASIQPSTLSHSLNQSNLSYSLNQSNLSASSLKTSNEANSLYPTLPLSKSSSSTTPTAPASPPPKPKSPTVPVSFSKSTTTPYHHAASSTPQKSQSNFYYQAYGYPQQQQQQQQKEKKEKEKEKLRSNSAPTSPLSSSISQVSPITSPTSSYLGEVEYPSLDGSTYQSLSYSTSSNSHPSPPLSRSRITSAPHPQSQPQPPPPPPLPQPPQPQQPISIPQLPPQLLPMANPFESYPSLQSSFNSYLQPVPQPQQYIHQPQYPQINQSYYQTTYPPQPQQPYPPPPYPLYPNTGTTYPPQQSYPQNNLQPYQSYYQPPPPPPPPAPSPYSSAPYYPPTPTPTPTPTITPPPSAISAYSTPVPPQRSTLYSNYIDYTGPLSSNFTSSPLSSSASSNGGDSLHSSTSSTTTSYPPIFYENEVYLPPKSTIQDEELYYDEDDEDDVDSSADAKPPSFYWPNLNELLNRDQLISALKQKINDKKNQK
eukprot:gene5399-6734_t